MFNKRSLDASHGAAFLESTLEPGSRGMRLAVPSSFRHLFTMPALTSCSFAANVFLY
jgi:hypothetical protein